ncbi:MAG: TIR domain-containing protein [Candidatus Binatia bacterium]
MRAIFISYRREDAEGQAGRLFDDLARHFGEHSVFMDVAGIEPGRDFRRVIDEHVASCGVLLAMIGKNWIDAADESGRRRLEDPMDFVRLETASALKRDIPVVPVLVHGARMPRADQLPVDLADLAYRNGVELTHARWDSDVQVLIKALSPYVESLQKPTGRVDAAVPAPDTAAASGMRNAAETTPFGAAYPVKEPLTTLLAASVAAVAIAVGGYAWYQNSSEQAAAIRQAALLAETKKQAAAEELATKKRPEEKAITAAFETNKQAAEKALAAEAEAKRLAREKAAAQEVETKRLAQVLEAKRRARDKLEAEEREKTRLAREQAAVERAEADRLAQIADGKKRDAEKREKELAVAEERERTRQKALADERERIRLVREKAAATLRARWPSYNFPPPNDGLLVYTIMPDGNPACASYNGAGCLWGLTYDQIDFKRLKPLVCGAEHRARWGATGYEDIRHWCNLARRLRADRR